MEKENVNVKIKGQQSICFCQPPELIGWACVAGKKEGEGPLGRYFDVVEEDPMFGGDNWEDAESRMQKEAVEMAIAKAGLQKQDIRYLIGGDLLGQLIATSFGIQSLDIPLIGVYGACSTMGESMLLGAVMVDGGYADRVVAMTSSHFAGAEKQFRFPLGYGNQRPLAASWTVTGSGAVVIAGFQDKLQKKISEQVSGEKCFKDSEGDLTNTSAILRQIVITGATPGKIVDFGLKDSMNMGACMAPAACDTIARNLCDFGRKPEDYDRIITGDLGKVGSEILIDMLGEYKFDIRANHMDCGIEIFDPLMQDTHAGGSGCGCSAITLTGYILRQIQEGKWKRVLFVPTGALLSPVSFNEGQSVPGIAHAVVLEGV